MLMFPVKCRYRPKKGRLTLQCDEQWLWLALDVMTREIVGVYVGARDEAAARQL